jgi:hypothetical protein
LKEGVVYIYIYIYILLLDVEPLTRCCFSKPWPDCPDGGTATAPLCRCRGWEGMFRLILAVWARLDWAGFWEGLGESWTLNSRIGLLGPGTLEEEEMRRGIKRRVLQEKGILDSSGL